jgi:hypothetical protein
MGERVRPLIEAAKKFSIDEREELLAGLLEIDCQFESDAADAVEWNRRFADIEAGNVETIEADDAIASVRSSLHSRRPG